MQDYDKESRAALRTLKASERRYRSCITGKAKQMESITGAKIFTTFLEFPSFS